MREIKFRAWDAKTKFMSGVIGDLENYLQNPDFTVMQYTGLKDKNGKEIYEGDILLNNDEKWKVYFDEGGYWMTLLHEEAGQNKFIFINEAKHSEVIGNIYENQELLTN